MLFFLAHLFLQFLVSSAIIPSLRRVIDLRSDAVTKPTDLMREQIFHAVVGDDVMGEDPTVNTLEAKAAIMFAKEKALWLPSGTMANLVATMTWFRQRDSSILLGEHSHMSLFEQGGISQIAGGIPRILPNEEDGTIDLNDIATSLRDPLSTKLVAIEDTHNYCGGRVLPTGYLDRLGELTREHAVPLHLDGARIWNAATATGLSLPEMVRGADSVAVSLSKGLGAPAGSMLLGPAPFIERARKFRKALGGGMRQVGVLAAAGLQALVDYEGGLLVADHSRTRRLATALSTIPGERYDSIQFNTILTTPFYP